MPYNGSSPLPVQGKITVHAEHNGKQTLADFYIIPGSGGCLLSWDTSTKLRLIDIVCGDKTEENIQGEYADLFSGLGQLKDFQVKLHIDETINPVAQPHRRIPFLLRKQVEAQPTQRVE